MLKSPPQDDAYGDEQQGREVPLAKKVATEFVGTFILMFVVVSTVVADAQHRGAEGVAAAAGLSLVALVAVVLAVVSVSGSHLNPAVSLAMGVFGYLSRAHVLHYRLPSARRCPPRSPPPSEARRRERACAAYATTRAAAAGTATRPTT